MTIPLAVYGSLRTGLALPYQPPDFDGLLTDRRPCLIPGRLVDLGPYPALVEVEADGPVVVGELGQLPDTAALARFDAYESYDPGDPGSSRYLRLWVQLRQPATAAWTYVYNRAWTEAMVVASGDWSDRGRRRGVTW